MSKNYCFNVAAYVRRVSILFIFVVALAILAVSAGYSPLIKATAAQTGVLQICKAVSGSGLENRIFKFKIGTLIVEVPVGQCSAPITIPSGSYVIEELLDGRIPPRSTFFGGFQLTGVSAVGRTPPSAVKTVDLVSRTATVSVAAGDVQNPTIIVFTNAPAPPPTPVLKICKIAGAGVQIGTQFTFDITVNGEPNTAVPPLIVLAGPAEQGGFCQNVADPYSDTSPNTFRPYASLTVTERAASGYSVSAITSSSGGMTSAYPAGRTATITLGAGMGSELTFTNTASGF